MNKRTTVLLLICLVWITAAGIPSDAANEQFSGPRVLSGGIEFRYFMPGAQSVAVAGDFNNWTPIALERLSKDGAFQGVLSLLLKKKHYRYRLIIDQVWQRDPTNPAWKYDDNGNAVSLFHVPVDMIRYGINPRPLGDNRYRFYLDNKSAKNVQLVGTFNNFNPFDTVMRRDHNGIWVAEVQVFPGRHYYCYVVDGEWKTDPTRVDVRYNRFGQEFTEFYAAP